MLQQRLNAPSFFQCARLRVTDNQHFWLKKELLVPSYKFVFPRHASNAVKISCFYAFLSRADDNPRRVN